MSTYFGGEERGELESFEEGAEEESSEEKEERKEEDIWRVFAGLRQDPASPSNHSIQVKEYFQLLADLLFTVRFTESVPVALVEVGQVG